MTNKIYFKHYDLFIQNIITIFIKNNKKLIMDINILDFIVYIICIIAIWVIVNSIYDEMEGVMYSMVITVIFTIVYVIIFVFIDLNISDINLGKPEPGGFNIRDYISW